MSCGVFNTNMRHEKRYTLLIHTLKFKSFPNLRYNRAKQTK